MGDFESPKGTIFDPGWSLLIRPVTGKPLPHLPFRVFYTYAPADSPLFYHVELRTPKDARGETDENGQAVIRIADYAWSVGLEAEEGEKGDWRIFWLSKELIRKGGVVETRYESTNHPKLKLELQPTRSPNYPAAGKAGNRAGLDNVFPQTAK